MIVKKCHGVIVCFVMVLLVLFTGCENYQTAVETEGETVLEEDLIVVGFSQIGSESAWRTANTKSIQNALSKENGFFLQFSNARQKQENQIKAIRRFISQQVDYIVFSPITESGWTTVLEEAKSAGIPVIVVDREIAVADSTLYTAWVGSDTVWEGEQAGQWLERDLIVHGKENEQINIVILEGTPGSSAQIGRSEGFKKYIRKHENWNVLAQESGDFTTAKGKEVMQKYLKLYDDIDVVVSQNDDMTLGAVEAMQEAGVYLGPYDGVRIISYDGGKTALEMVRNSIIDVDVECNAEQGEYVRNIINQLEKGKIVENKIYVPDKVFTDDNVGQYIDSRTY